MGSELRPAAAEDPGPAAPDDNDILDDIVALLDPEYHALAVAHYHPDCDICTSPSLAERLEHWRANRDYDEKEQRENDHEFDL